MHRVLKPGGLHINRDFLEYIGYKMEGSDLKEVLELIYEDDDGKYMFNGKSIAMTIRELFIVFAEHSNLQNEEEMH